MDVHSKTQPVNSMRLPSRTKNSKPLLVSIDDSFENAACELYALAYRKFPRYVTAPVMFRYGLRCNRTRRAMDGRTRMTIFVRCFTGLDRR